jgi:hypothetical protein
MLISPLKRFIIKGLLKLVYLSYELSTKMAANEKVFAMAGYSLNVQPEQMPY